MSGTTLVWGVKQSLRDYVADSGQIIPADGASSSMGEFTFPPSARAAPGEIAFVGSVEFTAYGGILRFLLAFPVIHVSSSTLSVLGRDGVRVVVADLTGDGAELNATLAAEGTALFDGMYPSGTALDRVRLEDRVGARVSPSSLFST